LAVLLWKPKGNPQPKLGSQENKPAKQKLKVVVVDPDITDINSFFFVYSCELFLNRYSFLSHWICLVVSVHAEKLRRDVLQSVVDLLWTQLDSLTTLVTNGATVESSVDPTDSHGKESENNIPAEAQLQCEYCDYLVHHYKNLFCLHL